MVNEHMEKRLNIISQAERPCPHSRMAKTKCNKTMSSAGEDGEKLDFLYTAMVGMRKYYSHFDELAIGSLS